VCVCVCVCVCVSFFSANALFGTSPQIIFAWCQNRRRRRPYESPKNVTGDIYWIIGSIDRCSLLLEETVLIPLIKKVSKKWLKICSAVSLNLLHSKRGWIRLFLSHGQHTVLQIECEVRAIHSLASDCFPTSNSYTEYLRGWNKQNYIICKIH